MFHRGWFWFDTESAQLDDDIIAEARQYGPVRTGRLGQATEEIGREPRPWAGVITRFKGQLRELDELRRRAPTLPILAVMKEPEDYPDMVAALASRGIEMATLSDNSLPRAFVQRAFTAACLPDARLAGVVQELASNAGLGARELQIVAYFLADDSRCLVRKRLGISENTLKCQVKGLLRKCGERNIDALAKNVLRAALLRQDSQPHHAKAAPRLRLVR